MNIFVFGSSVTSSYWNGAATYYRGIYRQLAALGHHITFAEPDIYGRQQHPDTGDFSYVHEIVYREASDIPALIAQAKRADVVIKHSGVGANDTELEAAVLDCQRTGATVLFWDVDAPATLARVAADPSDAFRALIPQYDFILTYGGGNPIVARYQSFGAKACPPIYNALDPETHFPVPPDSRFQCDLAFVGNRLPDRERRVEQFFLRAAELAPEMTFVLGGEGWSDKAIPDNIRPIGHVATGEHNAVNCSARMVLNINRDSMADVGFSPPTRVFEAAGAGACLITDHWPGVDHFFRIGKEILVANSAEDIVCYLRGTGAEEAEAIGHAMLERALSDHTYSLRAQEADAIFRNARSSLEAVGTR